MILVNPLHAYYRPKHLEHVVEVMRRLGPPTIRAYFDGEVWHAREGTHRLRACLALGVVPRLRAVKWLKSRQALDRARLAAVMHAHAFERVEVVE